MEKMKDMAYHTLKMENTTIYQEVKKELKKVMF